MITTTPGIEKENIDLSYKDTVVLKGEIKRKRAKKKTIICAKGSGKFTRTMTYRLNRRREGKATFKTGSSR